MCSVPCYNTAVVVIVLRFSNKNRVYRGIYVGVFLNFSMCHKDSQKRKYFKHKSSLRLRAPETSGNLRHRSGVVRLVLSSVSKPNEKNIETKTRRTGVTRCSCTAANTTDRHTRVKGEGRAMFVLTRRPASWCRANYPSNTTGGNRPMSKGRRKPKVRLPHVFLERQQGRFHTWGEM